MSANRTDACGYDSPYPAVQIILRVYVDAPLIAFGIAANLLNALIFRHARMRCSTINWFLLALALSDQLVMLCTFLMLTWPVLAEMTGRLALEEAAAHLTRWSYPLGHIAQSTSVYLTVSLSLYRYLGVCHPFAAQRLNSARLVQRAVVLCGAFAVVYNAPRWFDVHMRACFVTSHNRSSVRVAPSALLADADYYLAFHVLAYTTTIFVVPFVTLIVVNSLIIRTLYRSRGMRQSLGVAPRLRRRSPTDAVTTHAAPARERNTTLMLVAVNVQFLVCHSLAFVCNILQHTAADVAQRPFFTVMVEASNSLVVLNGATTIFVYAAFSTRYRQLLRLYSARTHSAEDTRPSNCQLVRLELDRRHSRRAQLSRTDLSHHVARRYSTQQPSSSHSGTARRPSAASVRVRRA